MPNYSENNTETTPQLRLEGVSFKTPIGSNCLLENISFQVHKGDRIAIVGPSGAGKTTLLRLLNRLSSPTNGAIYLENREYRQIPAIELRRQITLVIQESKLLGMSVREALAYPLKLRGVNSSNIAERISGAIAQLHTYRIATLSRPKTARGDRPRYHPTTQNLTVRRANIRPRRRKSPLPCASIDRAN